SLRGDARHVAVSITPSPVISPTESRMYPESHRPRLDQYEGPRAPLGTPVPSERAVLRVIGHGAVPTTAPLGMRVETRRLPSGANIEKTAPGAMSVMCVWAVLSRRS